ncbi:MAG: Hsp20/alpha crystallin family protein [Verrucomicrobiales bacterium]|nr:Hsp20/alpha crystallin family protein [Verrucomicrobiales bacterium]
MKLIRYDHPKLLSGVDHWLDSPGWGFGDFAQIFERLGRGGVPGTEPGSLATDVYEDGAHYFARFELPGVKKEELRVEFEAEVLSVSFETKGEGESRSARRAIQLPAGIDAESIKAKLEDGVLTVSLGKGEAVKPKEIEVA